MPDFAFVLDWDAICLSQVQLDIWFISFGTDFIDPDRMKSQSCQNPEINLRLLP